MGERENKESHALVNREQWDKLRFKINLSFALERNFFISEQRTKKEEGCHVLKIIFYLEQIQN